MGFREMHLFNQALLGKQGWRLITNPQSLCAQVLRGRYYPNGEFMTAGIPRTASKTWRSIVAGREALTVGLIKRIGAGDSVSIWDDNWIPGSRTMKPMGRRMATDKEVVSELIDQGTHNWNEPLIRELFFKPDVDRILQIPLRHINGEDSVAWALEPKGIYSVRSAYRGLVAEKEQREELQGVARPPLLWVTRVNGRSFGSWMFNRGYEYFGGEFSKAFCLIMQLSPGGMSKSKVPARCVFQLRRLYCTPLWSAHMRSNSGLRQRMFSTSSYHGYIR
jgi:hypothetical protein